MSQEACDTFTKFLGENTIVTIVVAPERCKGLEDFPAGAPLRIDLSSAFSPPMWPAVSPYGLDFRASFSRQDRAVSVPWGALVWAGVPNLASGAKPTQAQVAATSGPGRQADPRQLRKEARARRRGQRVTFADTFPAVALPPRPPSPDVWAWAFVALILGIGWGWAVFL